MTPELVASLVAFLGGATILFRVYASIIRKRDQREDALFARQEAQISEFAAQREERIDELEKLVNSLSESVKSIQADKEHLLKQMAEKDVRLTEHENRIRALELDLARRDAIIDTFREIIGSFTKGATQTNEDLALLNAASVAAADKLR